MDRLIFQVIGNLAVLPGILAFVWLFRHRLKLVSVSELNIRIAFSLALLFSVLLVSLVFSIAVLADLFGSAHGDSQIRFVAAATALTLFSITPLGVLSYVTLPRTFKKRFNLSPLGDKELHERIIRYAQLLELSRPPKVEQSDYPISPFVYGRPGYGYSLVLPNDFSKKIGVVARSTGQDAQVLEGFVLCHELSHILHKDVLLTSFAAVFSNPLIYWCAVSVLVAVGGAAVGVPVGVLFLFLWVILSFIYIGLLPYSQHKELLADAEALVHFSPRVSVSNVAINLAWVSALEKVFSFPLFVLPAMGFNSTVHDSPESRSLLWKFLNTIRRMLPSSISKSHPSLSQREESINKGQFVGNNTPLPSLGAYAYSGICAAFLFMVGDLLLFMLGSVTELAMGIAGTGRATPLLTLAFGATLVPAFFFVMPVAFAGKRFISLRLKDQIKSVAQRLGAFQAGFVGLAVLPVALTVGVGGLVSLAELTVLSTLFISTTTVAAIANIHRHNSASEKTTEPNARP